MLRTRPLLLLAAISLTSAALVVPPQVASATEAAPLVEWTPPADVAVGRSAGPALVTSAGDAFVRNWRRHEPKYTWQPVDGTWSKPRRLARAWEIEFVGYAATGPHQVTAVWTEVVDSGAGLQFYSRWLDADGKRGPIVPIGDVASDVRIGSPTVVASPGGAIAVAPYGAGREVLVRTADGEWGGTEPVPDGLRFFSGLVVNDAGTVTLMTVDEDDQILALTAEVGGAWTSVLVGPRPGESAVVLGHVQVRVDGGRNGDLVVLWSERDGEMLVAGHRSTDPSADWTVEVLDQAYDCLSVICARSGVDDAGRAAVLWVRPSGNAPHASVDVRLARFDPTSGHWRPHQTLLHDTWDAFDTTPIFDNFLDVAADGSVLAVYPDAYPHPDGRHTFTCSTNPRAACTEQGFLAGPLDSPRSASVNITAGPENGGIAVWTPNCPGGCGPNRVRAQTLPRN